jgi:flagellum-specific ATP synthase
VAQPEHIESARRFRQLHAKYQKARDLIQLGAYAAGHDAELDTAVQLHGPMEKMLQQGMHQPSPLADSVQALHALVGQ